MSVTSNSIIDSPFKSKALFANFSMLIPLVSINNFYAGLEQTQGDKTALERNGLPTESVGSIAQNPDGRSDYLRRHCFRYQSPEGFSSGRDVIGNEKYIIFGKMEYIRISNNDASFSVTMVHRFR